MSEFLPASAEFLAATFVVRLLHAAIAIAVMVVLLRLFDRLLNIKFREVWNEIQKDNNVAMAVYMGLRFVGCALVVGFVLS